MTAGGGFSGLNRLARGLEGDRVSELPLTNCPSHSPPRWHYVITAGYQGPESAC